MIETRHGRITYGQYGAIMEAVISIYGRPETPEEWNTYAFETDKRIRLCTRRLY